MKLSAFPLSANEFRPFGRVLCHPAAAARTPIVPVLKNDRETAYVTMGLIRYDEAPGSFKVSTVERHVHSEQLFVNLGGFLLMVVTHATPSGGPDLDRMQAFVCGPEHSFLYRTGIWHAPLSAVLGPATVASLLCRDGSDADVETVSLSQPIEVFLDE